MVNLSSVSLGGFVRGEKTKKVLAVTVGHVFYNKPGEVDKPVEEQRRVMVCPSYGNFGDRKVELEKWMEDAPLKMARKVLEKELESMESLKTLSESLKFGTVDYAFCELDGHDDKRFVKDVAFINVKPDRLGSNSLRWYTGFFTLSSLGCTGVERPASSSSNFPAKVNFQGFRSRGLRGLANGWRERCFISKLGHRTFSVYAVDHCNDEGIFEGDISGWVFDKGGRWVGQSIGSLTISTSRNEQKFVRSIYIPAENILKWPEELYGQKFKVVEHLKNFELSTRTTYRKGVISDRCFAKRIRSFGNHDNKLYRKNLSSQLDLRGIEIWYVSFGRTICGYQSGSVRYSSLTTYDTCTQLHRREIRGGIYHIFI